MPRPERLYLHIGHGKTGSSFLQSAFALSVDALAAQGIAYPIAADVAARARAGEITAGNFRAAPRLFRALLEDGWDGPREALLLSSESLFLMGEKDMPAKMRRHLGPGSEVRVLLYIRDPLDHAVSNYQQQVKRGGMTEEFGAFLQTYDLPARLGPLMAPLRDAGFAITTLNYSRHRDRLAASAEAWLGLPAGGLTLPEVTEVNRSMTNAELALQRAFNRHMARGAGALVSDPLCHRLPAIAPERPPVRPEALAAFLHRMRETIAAQDLGWLIPEAEMYRVPEFETVARDFPAPEDHPRYSFDTAQLEAVADAICAALGVSRPAEPAAEETHS